MVLGYDYQEVNIMVLGKLIDGIIKIIHPDKVEFRIEFSKQFLHFVSLREIFIRQGNIMFIANIDDMQVGIEHPENCFYGQYRC